MNTTHLCMGCMNDKGEQEVCPYCGWMEGTIPDMPQHLPPRSVLNNRYLIGRVLGQGGFGITYLAWDLTLNTRLAIKEYLPQAMATRYAGDTGVVPYSSASAKDGFSYGLERFLDEARTLARFSENPHIVSVRDYFSANGTAYLVMAYIDGITFKQYIAERGSRISYDTALTIMAPVMEALEEVHAVGLLHRDISPDNIFITRNNLVKILDFGAARYAIGEQSRSLSVILKAGYAPEEQYRSKGVQGPWTDIYATAATFYRALTGKVPPEALDRMHDDQLEAPSSIGVSIPPAAEAALMKALSVMGANRFQSMREFRDNILNASPGVQKVFTPPVQQAAAPVIEATVPLGKAGPVPPVTAAGPGLDKGIAGEPASGSAPPAPAAIPDLQKTAPLNAGASSAALDTPVVVAVPGTAAAQSLPAGGIGATVPMGSAPAYTPVSAGPFIPAGISAPTGISGPAGSGEAPGASGVGVPPAEGGAYASSSITPGRGKSKKKPLLAVAGALILVVLLGAGGYAVSQMGGDGNTMQQASVLTHGFDKSTPTPVIKNDITGIIISKSINETTLEPVEPVQEYLSSQKRFNAVVKTTRGLKEKMTGNWYFLGSGQKQLMFTYDVVGTGAEQLVWFWCEPAAPVAEGPWEFEAVMASGIKKSSAFSVVHDPALDVVAEPEYNYVPQYDYEPEVINPPVDIIEEPIEESYDYTQ